MNQPPLKPMKEGAMAQKKKRKPQSYAQPEGTKGTKGNQEGTEDSERKLGIRDMSGIVMIAAAIFNYQNVKIPPETTEDKMMLVVLGAMIIAGLMLLCLPWVFKKIGERRNKE